MIKPRVRTALIALAVSMTLAGLAQAQAPQGVSKNEIVIGTIQDLSGPVALIGNHFRNGMQMRLDEVNAEGGINGRKIRMVVEDSGWDTKKAVLAARKLLDHDKVFALVNVLGSSIAIATIPLALEKNVLSLFPGAPVPAGYEPFHKLKFAIDMPYERQMPIGVKYLAKQNAYKRIGVIYQDDDFGKDVLSGLEHALKDLGQALCERTTFKRGSTDFSSQVLKLREAKCDLVVIGGSTRETIGTMNEARKLDWRPGFLVSSSAYSAQVHVLGGAAVDGLYSTVFVPHPYPDTANKYLAGWIEGFKRKFNADPNPFSVMGYVKADLFVEGLRRAGAKVTPDTVAAAIDGLSYSGSRFGMPNIVFGQGKRLGVEEVRIAQIRNGRWDTLTGSLK